jgi:hypothetical protein
MQNGNYATHGETSTVARSIDLVDDRRIDIAAPQKIRVQRMRNAAVDRVMRGGQRLPDDLSAENLRTADVAALAAKNIIFDALESQQLQQIVENRAHRSDKFFV